MARILSLARGLARANFDRNPLDLFNTYSTSGLHGICALDPHVGITFCLVLDFCSMIQLTETANKLARGAK
jgi:hypothetical protein